jgi:hypothetical protein
MQNNNENAFGGGTAESFNKMKFTNKSLMFYKHLRPCLLKLFTHFVLLYISVRSYYLFDNTNESYTDFLHNMQGEVLLDVKLVDANQNCPTNYSEMLSTTFPAVKPGCRCDYLVYNHDDCESFYPNLNGTASSYEYNCNLQDKAQETLRLLQQGTSTTTQPANTSTQPANTSTQPENTSTQSANTSTQPENTATQPANTLAQLVNSLTQPQQKETSSTQQPTDTNYVQPVENITTTVITFTSNVTSSSYNQNTDISKLPIQSQNPNDKTIRDYNSSK